MYNAKGVEEGSAPTLFDVMRGLEMKAGMPMPALYLIDQDSPNAFATGRNPEHAAVAVTAGIMKILTRGHDGREIGLFLFAGKGDFGGRQSYEGLCALARLGGELERAPVFLHDIIRDREAKSRAAASELGREEWLRYPANHILPHARTLVHYAYEDLAAGCRCLHDYPSRFIRQRLQRAHYEVDYDLLYLLKAAPHGRKPVRAPDLEALGIPVYLVPQNGAGGEDGPVHLEAPVEPRPVDPREVLQVLDYALYPPRSFKYAVEQIGHELPHFSVRQTSDGELAVLPVMPFEDLGAVLP